MAGRGKKDTGDPRVSVARLSIGSNVTLVALKLAVGFWISSVSVLSEAVHSATDLLAAVIAFVAVRKAIRPPDEDHPFGHGKFENVSGALEALLIFAAAGYIIFESVEKLMGGVKVHHVPAGMAVMALSAAVNIVVSRRLMGVARRTDSIALEADALHLRTDIYTSLGVFGALAMIQMVSLLTVDPHWRSAIHLLDPIAAIAVALLILRMAWSLTRKSVKGLLDVPLPSEEDRVIREIIESNSGNFLEFHELRHRKSGSERHIDLHLVVARDRTVGEVHELTERIRSEIQRRLPRSNVLIHVEPCDEACPTCRARRSCELAET